MTTLRAKNVES